MEECKMAKKSSGGLMTPVQRPVKSGGSGKPAIVGKRKMKSKR
jgi:hypothetical protein